MGKKTKLAILVGAMSIAGAMTSFADNRLAAGKRYMGIL